MPATKQSFGIYGETSFVVRSAQWRHGPTSCEDKNEKLTIVFHSSAGVMASRKCILAAELRDPSDNKSARGCAELSFIVPSDRGCGMDLSSPGR